MDMIENDWENNLGRLLYQLDIDTKKLVRKLEENIRL